jgi:hypothetical protein
MTRLGNQLQKNLPGPFPCVSPSLLPLSHSLQEARHQEVSDRQAATEYRGGVILLDLLTLLGQNPPKDANDALRHETLDGEELILQMLRQVTIAPQ